MKEIAEDSAVQSSQWQGLTDFFPKLSPNIDAQELLDSINLYTCHVDKLVQSIWLVGQEYPID